MGIATQYEGGLKFDGDQMYITTSSGTTLFTLGNTGNATFVGSISATSVTATGNLTVGNITKGSAGFITIGDDSNIVSIGQTNEMNFMTDVNSDQTMYLNHRGYNNASTRFRSLEIRNGKGAAIANFNGVNKATTLSGTLAATNFSGSSSGTNTGDQTLPTLSSLGALSTSGGTMTGGLTGTTASFSGKVDFQGDAAIEGGSGYGVFNGYSTNANHFISVRGVVANQDSLSITGGHQTTFVEHANDAAEGWYFKSNTTGSYREIARIDGLNQMYLGGHKVWHAGNFTNNSTNWNTAYGWGNHAGLYLGATAKAADSNLLDGIDSSAFLRSNAADSFDGTLSWGNSFGTDAFDLNGGDIEDARGVRAREFSQIASGIPRNNLGDPTVTEMALFEPQFTCKTDLSNSYDNLADLTFYKQTTSSSEWEEITSYSDDQKRRFLRTNNSSVNIPNLSYKFRVEFNAKSYTFANAIYFYWSSQSHSSQVHIWKKRCSDGAWLQHTSSTTTVSSWPGHLYLPFSTIPWHETNTTSTGHYTHVRVEFTPNWSGHATYGDRNINIHGGQIWGGYPSGRRTPHSYDQNGKLFTYGDFEVNGKLYIDTRDANTSSTTALVMNGNEVEQRTLGSNAFNSTTIPSGNQIIDWTTDQGSTNIHSGNYTNTTYSAATASAAGLMSTTDKTKLDGIETGADVTDAIAISAAGAMLKSGAEISTAMKSFEANLSNQDDWVNSPVSILERDNIGTGGGGADKYAPNLNFHWRSRISNSLWMNSGGVLHYGSYGTTGVPALDGTFKAGTLYAGAQDITATKVGNWNTAYGWGNHASAGYGTSSLAIGTTATTAMAGNTTIPSGSQLVRVLQNQNYAPSDGTSSGNNSTNRANYGTGLTIYEGYSVGTNRPHTYDTTAQFMSTTGQGFELSIDWVGASNTPLKIRSLRDCCQGWNPWTEVYTEASFSKASVLNSNVTLASLGAQAAGSYSTASGVEDNADVTDTANVVAALTAGTNVQIAANGTISATDTDTVYTHPTSAGNKHIPTGGAAGQFLKYSSSGTATWATPSYTTNTDTVYTHPTTAGNKHIPAGGAAGQFLKYSSDGTATWATPSYTTNTNTQLSNEQVQDIVGAMFSNNSESNITVTYQDGDGTIDLAVAANYGSWDLMDENDTVNRVDSGEHVKFSNSSIQGTGTSTDPFVVSMPNTTYTADGNYGMTLNGTAFRLENDRRRNSSTQDIHTGNTHDYTFYDASHGIRWYTAGSEEMRLEDDGDLHVDGDVIAFSTTVSDERLKDNVETIDNAIHKVKQLRGVEYTWNEGSRKGQREIGVIAQEVEKVVPEIVHEKKLPFVGDETYKTVDYEKLVALLIESNKELAARIETLEAKLL
jgi:hypothetical protein